MNSQDRSSWIREVEDCIVEFLASNSSGSIEFRQQDITGNFEDRLQEMFPNNNNIPQTVNRTLGRIGENGQIENPAHGRYRLIEGERLCLQVKLEKCKRKLQAIAQILEQPL